MSSRIQRRIHVIRDPYVRFTREERRDVLCDAISKHDDVVKFIRIVKYDMSIQSKSKMILNMITHNQLEWARLNEIGVQRVQRSRKSLPCQFFDES